jgi:hypothetical protein
MSDGYNGWTNWETWVTNLWIEEGMLDLFEVGEQARYFAEQDESTAAYEMGKWMREQVEEFIGEQPAGLVADYVGGAIGAVNWTEIAGHHTDEAIRNEKEQTENANA